MDFADGGKIETVVYSAAIGALSSTARAGPTAGSTTASTTIALTVSPTGTTTGFACHIDYTVASQWGGGFGASISINNTGTTAISNWTLTWAFADGQIITQLWNGIETQNGANHRATDQQ